METVDKYVPKIKKNLSNPKEKKTWLSDNVRKKIKIKVNAFKKYLCTRAQDDFNSYARARNQAKWACRNTAKEYERTIAQQAKNKSQSLLQSCKSQTKDKTINTRPR